MRSAFVGFDSAWSGKQGESVFALFEDDRLVDYRLPAAADFDHARSVIRRCQNDADYTLVAVDQPTMVPNATGMRPVERVASTVKTGAWNTHVKVWRIARARYARTISQIPRHRYFDAIATGNIRAFVFDERLIG